MPATDANHQRRLKTFDPAGDLAGRAASLWRAIEAHEQQIARAFWDRYREHSDGRQRFDDTKMEQLVERILPYLREKFLRVGELKWIGTARSYVEDAMAANVSLTTLLAGLSGEAEALVAAMRETYSDPADRAEASRTIHQMNMVEIDVFVAHAIHWQHEAHDRERNGRAEEFNRRVVASVARASSDSDMLRGQASQTAAAARGMLGCLAEASSWANVTPPTALIACSAMTPSLPLPDRTTPADRLRWMAASDRNRWSIGMCGTDRGGRGVRARWPSARAMAVPGGMT